MMMLLRYSLSALILLGATSCWRTAREPASPRTFDDRRARDSYALGFAVASQVEDRANQIDPRLVCRGFEDALHGEALLVSSPSPPPVKASTRRNLAGSRP
jgi:hypothetical protein